MSAARSETQIDEAFDRVPFLRALGPADRQALRGHAELRVLQRNQSFWREGQATGEFAFVLRGRIKMIKAAQSGRQTIIEMASTGDLMCANAVCGFIEYCCTSVSMEEGTEIVILPRREVLALVETSPAVARAFIREMTGRGLDMCERVEELAGVKVEQRIATLLLKLADRAGLPLADGSLKVPVPLSRQDIADLCGTTLETAIRVMSGFKKKGIVKSAARGFVVQDRDALEAVVGHEPTGHPRLAARA